MKSKPTDGERKRNNLIEKENEREGRHEGGKYDFNYFNTIESG